MAQCAGGIQAPQTLYNRWKRWSDKGIFARMMAGLAAGHGEKKTVMIDATYLKVHRTATSMGVKKKGAWALLSSLPDVNWLLGDCGYDADWFREAL